MRERLTRNDRRLGRRIAATLMRDCGGNLDVAKSLVHERCEDAGMSPALIFAMVKFIIFLLDLWYSMEITDPGDEPLIGEDGFTDDEYEVGDPVQPGGFW